jgi:ribosomal protein S18 acetylase RimI-like enzyme
MERQVNEPILLRPAVDADFPALAHLLHGLACAFITPAMATEVAATFLRENDEAALRAYRERGDVFTVAEIAGELAGYIAIRPPTHLFHLFVDARWHRRGVGRALWEAARVTAGSETGTAHFTVNSSPYAVPAYQALGFRCDGALQTRNGVQFQPMVSNGA